MTPSFNEVLVFFFLALLTPLVLLVWQKRENRAGKVHSGGVTSAAFEDTFDSVKELKTDLRAAGLESCNLIVCVDHTQSNTFTGRRTFQGRNLHEISASQNFYEQAMRLVSRTLAEFDEDNLIPAYGFGSIETKASKLFSYNPGEAPCVGLEGVLSRYRSLAPVVRLSGGTSFAPAIRKACAITASTSPPQYHILLLICDGQVSDECKAETRAAIQEAANFPLSIVCIGVGDGPWEEMEEFDDMTERAFDNFQFVPFESTMANARREAAAAEAATAEAEDERFALSALMEIPSQFRAIKRLGLLQSVQAPSKFVPVIDPPPTATAPPAAAQCPNKLAASRAAVSSGT